MMTVATAAGVGPIPFRETADEQFRGCARAGDRQAAGARATGDVVLLQRWPELKEIGAVLKVTESRACQLHGQALVQAQSAPVELE